MLWQVLAAALSLEQLGKLLVEMQLPDATVAAAAVDAALKDVLSG